VLLLLLMLQLLVLLLLVLVLCVCSVLQGAVKQQLQRQGVWPAWESVWHNQVYFTLAHDLAYLPGKTRVMSLLYQRSKTRNGTRVQVQLPNSSGVMQSHACEVHQFIELQHRPAAGNSTSPATANTSAAGQQGAGTGSVLLAVVQRWNTVVRTDQPELANEMLEARLQDMAPELNVIALSEIVCALNACQVIREGQAWLMFTPHSSRSLGHTVPLPASVYNSY
jgi:hypothetical protein